ncbi:cell division FtsA domain-containing protein [Kurthia sibirica]|uniref:Cell division protein n=1 Tax=Kurthia sibirica TaxID=202750 RepID=A0A2U3ANY3_9BACL|nr:cell division FtsA domain-containing protein [Kurthia sibirica]PWI26241.1 cell division protein [Kurthia sibirica]GEK33854.1 ATPase [Kurthia sibirica]
MTEKLFALDIGTRSVVGIILERHEDHYHVVDLISKEHSERAMVDGQIHNVVYVANVISFIKTQLEEKHGPLHKVSIAAAGRSLKTEQAATSINIKNRRALTETDIDRLELSAVQEAQANLLQHQKDLAGNHYYCVGYSVLYYRLDGEEIGSLIDQQGTEASIEVIATFLPRVVVESLIAALKRADLEMDGLTLEPIAAINALIPTTMRRLNIALVDIGAGTSDIAITDKSTVIAYGMVPIAGDEITEALSDHYLLDFPVAETIKKQLTEKTSVTISDILGFDEEIESLEVINIIKPAILNLATKIADEIRILNSNQPPKAVILIGGGSLTPTITKELSRALDLTEQRVAVRTIDAIQGLTREAHVPASPELVTPIGIAIAAQNTPIKYMSVTVNEQTIRLFELKEMAVTDALLAANIVASKLYGKPGLAMSVTLNNRLLHIPGGHGSPTTIQVNGVEATMKTLIKNGDHIELIEGLDGIGASAMVKDLLDAATELTVMVNDSPYTLAPTIAINGIRATLDTQLKDGDSLTIHQDDCVRSLLTHINQEDVAQQCEPFIVYVNDQKHENPAYCCQIQVNGVPSSLHQAIANGDSVTWTERKIATIATIAQDLHIPLFNRCSLDFQGVEVILEAVAARVLCNNKEIALDATVTNGAKLQFITLDLTQWTYQDVFKYTTWQLPENFKGTFELLRNGEKAQFDTVIFGGDQLAIRLIPTTI